MRMTIDKTIEFFNTLEYLNTKDKEAKDVAIDTMRKYQKIERLVKFYKNAGEVPIFVLEGVLKDENDDN